MDSQDEEIANRLTFDVTPLPGLRAAVRSILERPHAFEWTTQGFGMLRCYLDPDKVWRLNVWHSLLMVPNVSTIHDHPWDFKSWVINGTMINRRYWECTVEQDRYARPHQYMKIKTGEGGGPREAPKPILLSARGPEVYRTGRCYVQTANEIHHTMYHDGTVTLNYRERRQDGEHARVFWPAGTNWVDAEPSAAHPGIVAQITKAALEAWDVEQQLVHDAGLAHVEQANAEARPRVFVPDHARPGDGFDMR